LIQGNELAGLFDPAFELILRLERATLGGDESQHHHLALGHEAQWLESTRTAVVVFEEEPVDVELAKEGLSDEVVTTSAAQ